MSTTNIVIFRLKSRISMNDKSNLCFVSHCSKSWGVGLIIVMAKYSTIKDYCFHLNSWIERFWQIQKTLQMKLNE